MTVSDLLRALAALPLRTEIYVRCDGATEPFAMIAGVHIEPTGRVAFIDLLPEHRLSSLQRERRYRDASALRLHFARTQAQGT